MIIDKTNASGGIRGRKIEAPRDDSRVDMLELRKQKEKSGKKRVPCY